MQRELTFRVGAGVAIALAAAIAAGLVWAGAGAADVGAWLAVPFSALLGAFFWHVANEMRSYRREYLRALEAGEPPPPGGPPM